MTDQQLNEDHITEYVIDFSELRENKLDESFLRMFGNITKWLLKSMFGGETHIPVSVRGSRSEVNSFAKAIGSEKRYLDAYKKYGLDDPRTHKSKSMLRGAVDKFTRATGLKWPFK
tara:strand:- start:392 stop:739 length:348 start_codon:yes stop_codon:yes gene_type:complete